MESYIIKTINIDQSKWSALTTYRYVTLCGQNSLRLYAYIYIHLITFGEKQVMNLKGSREQYTVEFETRTGKGQML